MLKFKFIRNILSPRKVSFLTRYYQRIKVKRKRRVIRQVKVKLLIVFIVFALVGMVICFRVSDKNIVLRSYRLKAMSTSNVISGNFSIFGGYIDESPCYIVFVEYKGGYRLVKLRDVVIYMDEIRHPHCDTNIVVDSCIYSFEYIIDHSDNHKWICHVPPKSIVEGINLDIKK